VVSKFCIMIITPSRRVIRSSGIGPVPRQNQRDTRLGLPPRRSRRGQCDGERITAQHHEREGIARSLSMSAPTSSAT
jgi:hypothetical protein